MLNMNSHELKHALSALISVVVSTQEGVDYVSHTEPRKQNFQIIEKVIQNLRDIEDGSVTQRFNIAVLQKLSSQTTSAIDVSVTDQIIELFVSKNMIQWCLNLLSRAQMKEIHAFCLDFSSALLANMLHSSQTLEWLEGDQSKHTHIMSSLLNLLNGVHVENDREQNATQTFPNSVIIHLLICLSYLSKERFTQSIENCKFVDKISQFVEVFSVKQVGESD